jgi:hypothetical protein
LAFEWLLIGEKNPGFVKCDSNYVIISNPNGQNF